MSQTYILAANGIHREQIRANLHAFIQRLPESKSWQVEIKQYRKARTDPQNHALFGVAYPALEQATGFTKDELHAAFCRRFFGTITVDVVGEQISRPYRTTTTNNAGERDVLDAGLFSDFYAMVQQVGAEAGVDVPSPDAMLARGVKDELARRFQT